MSISIYKSKSNTLSKTVLERCYQKIKSNPKMGFCYVQDGKLTIKNNFDNLDAFFDELDKIQKDRDVLMEFCDGAKDMKNPGGPFKFKVEKANCAIVLTGDIYHKKEYIPNKHISQACNLINHVFKLMPLTFKMLFSDYFKWLIEEAMPAGATLSIMNGVDGSVKVFNKNVGITWKDDNWFSESIYSGQDWVSKNKTYGYGADYRIKCSSNNCMTKMTNPQYIDCKPYCCACFERESSKISVGARHSATSFIDKTQVKLVLPSF